MPMARLKKLGGSVSLTIPAPIAREVKFDVDTEVSIDVENGTLVIRRAPKRRTLQDFLADCDLSAAPSPELARFDAASVSGDEVI